MLFSLPVCGPELSTTGPIIVFSLLLAWTRVHNRDDSVNVLFIKKDCISLEWEYTVISLILLCSIVMAMSMVNVGKNKANTEF